MVRNVMKHTVHKWGGNILSIYEGIEPPFSPKKLFFVKKVGIGEKGGLYPHKLKRYCPPLHSPEVGTPTSNFFMFSLGYSKHFIPFLIFFLAKKSWDWRKGGF